jgi:hypothetical protein
VDTYKILFCKPIEIKKPIINQINLLANITSINVKRNKTTFTCMSYYLNAKTDDHKA